VSFRRLILPGSALLVVLTFVTLTRADPDLWGHVRFGGDIIDSGTILLPDTYSFTSDKPWINHEWLSEIVMAAAFRMAGASGLVLLKLAIILLSMTCIWRIAKDEGADARTAVVLTALGLVGILTRAQQVRPQLFSVLCFSVLALLLRRAERNTRVLWLVPLLMIFWANTHGGWLVGCGTLGLWCAANTWTAWRRGDGAGPLVEMWTACAMAVAATLINPYGVGLWRFLASTVGPSRRFISEWGPVYTDIALLGPWCVFALIAVTAVRRADRSTRLAAVVIPLFWGTLGFKVSRLDAFFALSTLGFLAPEIVRVIQERRRAGVPRQQSLAAQGMAAIAALAILAFTIPQLKTNLFCIDVHAASNFPESQAMSFVREHQLKGRMVTFFDWGQYAIWHKPSDLRVSMDGRRETVYTDRTVDLHLDMYLALQDGLPYLDSLHADYVWVPRELPLAETLSRSALWRPVYRSGRSVIFARSGLAPVDGAIEEGTDANCRCFPGP
jgi:hypothetical protein